MKSQKKKLSSFWGRGKWGREGSQANVSQLKKRGFKGVSRKLVKKKGWTVYYTKKGKGPTHYVWK